jgi:hypothetical protein
MFKEIEKLVKATDFLGYKQNIKINSHSSHKSSLGGLLSIIIITLSASCAIYLALDLFVKGDPVILASKVMDDQFGPYPFDKNGLELYISLEYFNFSYYMDESIYRVSAYQTEITNIRNDNGTISQILEEKTLDVVKCSDYYSAEDIEAKLIKFPIEKFYCLKPGQADIKGYWGGKVYKSVRVDIKRCKNTTSDSSCSPDEVIDNTITNGIVQFLLSNVYVDPKNFTNPLQHYYKELFDYISPRHSILFHYAYSVLQFITDEGIIFQSFNKIGIPEVDHGKTSYSFTDTDLISSITIEGANFGNKYNRSYQKVQDVLTRSGGLIKALMLIGQGIAFFLSYSKFKIDSFFGYHSTTLPTKDIIRNNHAKLDESKTKQNNFLVDNTLLSKINTPTTITKIIKTNKPIKINILNYWFTKKTKTERVILDLKEKLINISLSQETLMKTHYDVEIMKFILLSNDEINVIDESYKYLFCDNIRINNIREKLLSGQSKLVLDECSAMNKIEKLNCVRLNI